jgi:hypothetical protein
VLEEGFAISVHAVCHLEPDVGSHASGPWVNVACVEASVDEQFFVDTVCCYRRGGGVVAHGVVDLRVRRKCGRG